MSDENFLSRWSRKKIEAKADSGAGAQGPTAGEVPAQPTPEAGSVGPAAGVVPAEPAPVVLEPGAGTLPPVESLTHESDFLPFMKAEVDPGLKRQAFKKLIEDPRYNIMDGLDVYIDDYSKADPLPDGWLEKMNQVKYLGLFKPPEEEVAAAPMPAAPPLQNPMAEQPLASPGAAAPADTLAAQIPPSGVGKSGGAGEGV